jgi:hypothetical protein
VQSSLNINQHFKDFKIIESALTTLKIPKNSSLEPDTIVLYGSHNLPDHLALDYEDESEIGEGMKSRKSSFFWDNMKTFIEKKEHA